MMRNFTTFFTTALITTFLFLTNAVAADWTVTKSINSNDGACDNDCSLREAVAAADSGDTIVFSGTLVGQAITLGNEEIVITKRITIDGYLNDPNVAFVSGSTTSRIFLVKSDAGLILKNMILVQGNGKSDISNDGYGGAILTSPNSNLSLDRVAVRGNKAEQGGAIMLLGAGNHSITNSSFTGNSAESGSAITVSVSSSLYLSNTTLSGNFLIESQQNLHGCGALCAFGENVTVRNCTIANNSARNGGGIFMTSSGGVNIGNTIVTNNTATESGDDIRYINGAQMSSAGGNLIQNTATVPAGTFTQQNDQTGVNPLLAPLHDYGGHSILSHSLQAGSPARNTGLNQNAIEPLSNQPLQFDTRGSGFPRIAGGTVDKGAFEDQSGDTSLIVSKKTNSNDFVCDTDCSLREAVYQASVNAGTDTITFAPNVFGTLDLGGSEILINNQNVNIVGYPNLNANTLIVSGANANRIFKLDNANVSLVGLTLANGNGAGAAPSGFGGAVYAEGGSLMLDRVVVQNNSAVTNTGGVFLYNGANHRILNSTFSGNQTAGACGGFNVAGGTLFVANTTVSRNTATGGGAGFCASANTVVRNSTVTGNTTGFQNGAAGGIRAYGSGNLNLGNTIVAGNNATNQPELSPIDAATITSAGHNHIGDSAGDSVGSGVAYQTSDSLDVSPLLGELANNGGSVPTHSLMVNSPAINTGINSLAVDPFDNLGLANDARGAGFARINGTTVDKGAFESNFITTAASVTIGGRVTVQGRGLRSALVTLTDNNGNTRTAMTGTFGYYRFADVQVGETYVINVVSKRFRFDPRVLTVAEETNELNFAGDSDSR